MKYILLLTLPLVFLTACLEESPSRTADKIAEQKTAKLMDEAARQVDIPAITKFTEKRLLKQIYELRDRNTVTYTYIIDMNGKKHFFCQSQGYGIPFSAQFTNPQKVVNADLGGHYGDMLVPQPEPNGLFMPDSTSATWVLCLDPKTKQATPVYVEPQIVVSSFKM